MEKPVTTQAETSTTLPIESLQSCIDALPPEMRALHLYRFAELLTQLCEDLPAPPHACPQVWRASLRNSRASFNASPLAMAGPAGTVSNEINAAVANLIEGTSAAA